MSPEVLALLIAAAYGVGGGVVRLLVVSLKTMSFRKISWGGFWVYALVVVSVGAFSGIVLSFGAILSFLAGYAGLDLIEGYYKSFMKKAIKLK